MLSLHSRTPKFYSTILVILFIVASFGIKVTAGVKTIRVNFEKSDIVFSKHGGYDILSLNTPGGFQDTTKIGEPRLPVKTIRVLIPEKAKMKGIRVVSKQESPLEGTYTLEPLQKTFFTGEEEEGKVVAQKQAIYMSNTDYPQSAVELMSEEYFREYQFVEIGVYPVQYKPLSKALVLNREVIVEIEYQEGVKQAPLKQLRPDRRKQQELRRSLGKLISNPEDIGLYYGVIEGLSKSIQDPKEVTQPLSICSFPSATEGRNVDYVIITNDALASSFQRLADWKTKKGVVTVVKTVSWISQNYSGCDPQQKIRHFIQDAYSKWNVDYILLGGDDEIIPLRVNSTISEYAPVSDLYYSEMTSTDYDWNQNGDDKFGDILTYYSADVWVGRAPVHNTAEVDLFINKVFTYERNSLAPSLPDPSYLKTFLSLAGLTDNRHGWTWDVGVCAKMRVDSAFIYPNPDMQIYKIYEDSDDPIANPFHDYFPKSDYPYHLYDERLNKTSALQALNRGYGIVNYVEHSNWGAMAAGAKTYGGGLVLDDIDGLTNGNKYSVCFLVGCSPSALDYECFGERFLLCKNGGGVAVIGPSRTSGFYPSHQFDFYFFESLFAGKNYNVGKAFGLAWYSDYTASFFNLLGDPEMPVWTKIPDQLTVTHPISVHNNENDFPVTIGGLKNGEEAVVCLKKGEEDYAVLPVTGTGSPVTANFIFTPDTPGEMTVTVTAHNCIPYEAIVPVTQTDVAHLYVDNTTINDDQVGESHGNGDGKIDAGETIELSIRIKNTGSIVASSVVATFEAYKRGTNDLHPDITIIDGSENYGNIVAGGSANCLDDYEFTVSPNCPDGEVIEFRLTLSYDIGFLAKIPESHQIKTETFYLQVGAPKVKHTGHYFEELLEAGSEIGLYIELSNYGSGVARGVTATLSSTDPDVQSIVNPTISVGDINPNSSNSSTGFFDIIISSDYPGMTEPIDFTFIMQDVYGHQWQQNFNLKRRPDPPTGLKYDGYATGFDLIWEPNTGSDFMGYNVYRSNTVGGPYQKVNNRLIDSVSYYKEVGLPKETVYYYRVTAVDTSLNESDMTAPLEAWTNIQYLTNWPVKLRGKIYSSPTLFDVDNDGKMEIFIADQVGRVYAFNHTGAELFDIDGNPGTVSGFAYEPGEQFWSSPSIADIDNDGKYELIISGRVYPYLYCWKIYDGNGDGKPDLMWKVAIGNISIPYSGTSLNTPVIGDIDYNGTMEIVIMTENGNIHIRNSIDGSQYGSEPWKTIYPLLTFSTPAVADLDGDGDLEIIIGGGDGVMHAWHHNGTEMWSFDTKLEHLYIDEKYNLSCAPAVADIDLDGNYEIIFIAGDYVGNNLSQNCFMYLLNSTGQEKSGWENGKSLSNVGFVVMPSPAVGNLDSDGQLEIVIGTASEIYAFNHDGALLSGFPQQGFNNTASSSPMIADIDGNAGQEIIVGSADKHVYAWHADGSRVKYWPARASEGFGSSVAVGDINGDGKNEVIGCPDDRTIFIWDTKGTGQSDWPMFHGNAKHTGCFRKRVTSVNFPTATNPVEVAMADLNNDGKQDLAVVCNGSQGPNWTVSVLLNQTTTGSSNPLFSSHRDFYPAGLPFSLALSDFNQDGKKDIAVVNTFGAGSNKITTFRNTTPDGSLDPTFVKKDFDVVSGLIDVAAGDLTNDGMPDIAAVGSGDYVHVLINGLIIPGWGFLEFWSDLTFPVGSGPKSVVMADFNGDGRQDIATANINNTVNVILNTGPNQNIPALPTFSAPYTFNIGITTSGYYVLAVGDINVDGKPDLAVTNVESKSISILLNTRSILGLLSFTRMDLNTVYYPYYVAIGDLTGDGKPDLTVTSGDDNVAVFKNTILPGTATPTFSCSSIQTLGAYTWGIALGDLNGNGGNDLSVANWGSNTVSVLLNPYNHTVSGTISSNTIWDGNVVVEGDVTIASGVKLTITPGTNILFKQNIKIEVAYGGKIIANGLEGTHIRFIKYDSNKWNSIILKGNNNEFTWCLFDGGTDNVNVKSLGNIFSNCTFRHGSRGISSDYNYNGGYSTFTLNNVLVDSNVTGIYLHGANPNINRSVISNNTGIGIDANESVIPQFTNSVVEENGSYGIQAGSGCYFYMGNGANFYTLPSEIKYETMTEGAGKDSIYNNCIGVQSPQDRCEIVVRDYGFMWLGEKDGDRLMDGFNQIIATGKYISNSAHTGMWEYREEWTLPARMNRWVPLESIEGGRFNGPVDPHEPIFFSPCVYAGIRSGTVPILKIANPNGGETPTGVITAAIAEKLTEQSVETSQKQVVVDLKNSMLKVRSDLSDPRNSDNRARLLGKLNLLSMNDPKDETRERSAVTSILAQYRERLTNRDTDPYERLCNEAGLVNEAQIALRSGEMSRVEELIAKYAQYVENKDHRRALLFAEMTVSERRGNYAKAWEALQTAKAIKPDADRKKAYVAPSYDNLEAMLLEKAQAAGIVINEGQSRKDVQELPRSIELSQNYPNPFNPTTEISYQLSAVSRVSLKVYDMLGRVVAVLEDGVKEAGYYTNTFNASRLASGVYFSRLTVKPSEGNAVVLVKKMILMK